MSAPSLTFAVAHPDPNFHPATVDDLFTATGGLKDLATVEFQGDFTPYVQGNSVPAVNDQDKIWFKYDPAGRPLGTYKFYSGHWVRVYPFPVGTIMLFSGDPTGLFDGTGLGIIDTDWYGFCLMNGNHGTPDLTDKFVIASNTFSSGWKSNILGTPLQSGGATSFTLDNTTTYRPAIAELTFGKWQADGNAASSSGNLRGDVNTDTTKNTTAIGADPGNQTPLPVSIIPPFYALAYAMWCGFS